MITRHKQFRGKRSPLPPSMLVPENAPGHLSRAVAHSWKPMVVPKKAAGFTLIEVLVSVTILAIIMSMILSMFDVYTRTLKSTRSKMEMLDEVRTIVLSLSREIGSAMVRTDPDRYLNMRIVDTSTNLTLYSALLDENITSLTNMSFVSHYGYRWVKPDVNDKEKSAALYRVSYNTKNELATLLGTASSSTGQDLAANIARLKTITLSYRSGGPYAWTTATEFQGLFDQNTNIPIMRNLFDMQILSYNNIPIDSTTPSTNAWNDSTALPHYMEIIFYVADENTAPKLWRNLTDLEQTTPIRTGITFRNRALTTVNDY